MKVKVPFHISQYVLHRRSTPTDRISEHGFRLYALRGNRYRRIEDICTFYTNFRKRV